MDDLAITTPDTPSPPDFGLAAPGDPANVPVGSFVDVPISISRLNGSNGNVSLAVTNLPPGMRAEITPNPVGGTGATATLRLSALDSADRFVDYREITITGTPGPGAGSGTRTVRKLVRIVDNCMPRYRSDYIDARADCIKSIGPDKLQIVGQKVHLNGLVLDPASGDRTLTIDTKKRTITSDGDFFAITHPDLPELQVYVGPINWDLGGTGSDPKSILDYDITGVKKLKGIPVQRLQAALTKTGKTNLRPTLRLGFWPFDYFGAITSTTQFTIDNDNGADFSGLEIKADRVAVLGLELKDVSVKWQQGGTWAGGATVVLRFANAYEVGAGFGLKDGGFDFARGSVGALNVAVSPGIFLQRIGFEVRRNPFSLAGTVGFSGGPSVAGKQAVTVDGTFKAVLDDPWVLEVSGKAKVAERFELGEASLRYTSGGLFELAGKAQWNLSVAYVNGSVSGFVDGGVNAFDLEGSVRGCISVKYLPDPCAGAKFLVSNIGIAACIDLTIVSGGVGYYWGGDFDLFGGSCDLSPWRPTHSRAVAAGAGQARSYTLPAGLPSAAFAVEGVGDAPGITLTGPHGEKISVSAAAPFARTGNLVAMLSENGNTYVVVKRPAAGTWTITDDGAVPIRRVREAVGLPDPSVSARVTGRGRSRTLHWRLRPLAGSACASSRSARTCTRWSPRRARRAGRCGSGPPTVRRAGGRSSRWWSRTNCCERPSPPGPTSPRPGSALPGPASCASRAAALALWRAGGRRGPASATPCTSSSRTGGGSAHRRSASPVGHAERSRAALRRDRDRGGADERQRPRSVGASLDPGPSARPSSSRELEDDHRVRLHREGQLQRRARRPVRGRLTRHSGHGGGRHVRNRRAAGERAAPGLQWLPRRGADLDRRAQRTPSPGRRRHSRRDGDARRKAPAGHAEAGVRRAPKGERRACGLRLPGLLQREALAGVNLADRRFD